MYNSYQMNVLIKYHMIYNSNKIANNIVNCENQYK